MTREGSRESWSSARLVARALARVFAKSISSSGRRRIRACLRCARRRGAGQGPGDADERGRLCAPRRQTAPAGRRGSANLRHDCRHQVRPPDRRPGRQAVGGRSRFRQLRPRRSRRQRNPPGAGTQGHTERHGGGRAPVHRPVARYLERPAAIVAAGRHQGTGRAREGGRAAAAAVRSGTRHQETPADPRARVHAADVYALRVRAARWRRRLDHPQQGTADAELRFRPDVRPCRREGRHRAEHLRHHPEGRRREHGRRVRAARRCRRAFLPRGAELRGRHRLRREAGEPAEA